MLHWLITWPLFWMQVFEIEPTCTMTLKWSPLPTPVCQSVADFILILSLPKYPFLSGGVNIYLWRLPNTKSQIWLWYQSPWTYQVIHIIIASLCLTNECHLSWVFHEKHCILGIRSECVMWLSHWLQTEGKLSADHGLWLVSVGAMLYTPTMEVNYHD